MSGATPATQHDTTLADLRPDPRNARRHSERNRAAVTTSLAEVGFMRPMVAANDGTLIAGNLTAEALADLGMDDVIVVRSDGTRPIVHIREDVDPGSEVAIKGGLYDNLARDLSDGYDSDVLAALLEEVDLSPVLMTAEEAATLLVGTPDFTPAALDEQGKLDETATTTCPECGHVF